MCTVYIPQKGYVFSEAWCAYLENIFSPKMYSSILENTLIFVPGTFFGIFLFQSRAVAFSKKGAKGQPRTSAQCSPAAMGISIQATLWFRAELIYEHNSQKIENPMVLFSAFFKKIHKRNFVKHIMDMFFNPPKFLENLRYTDIR